MGAISLVTNGVFFFPGAPEFFGCAGCSIFYKIFIRCQNDLRVLKELWDVLILLISDHLFYSLFYRNQGSLALDHRKRDSVDKQDDVGTNIVLLVSTVH